MSSVLREIVDSDIVIFYQHQIDPVANAMLAYAGHPPAERATYDAKWATNRLNPAIVARTIVADGQPAGYVTCFQRFGVREIGYWIGQEHWGKGLATAGLRELLTIVTARPLSARVAKHNGGSRRVVEKCGFAISGEDRYTPVPGGPEIHEWVLTLAG